jgi:hypothetical protein
MIQPGGAERVMGAAAAWLSPELGSSRTLLVLRGSQRPRGLLAAGLGGGEEPGSPGAAFAAFGSPCVPSEGNLSAESGGRRLVRRSAASWRFRRETYLVSRQTVRAVVARKRMGVE